MNKTEALQAIHEGHRVTHRAFTAEEYLEYSRDGSVIDQSGGFFGDQWATPESNPMWADGWEYWVSPNETTPQVQTGILSTLLRKLMGPNYTSPSATLSDDCYRPGRVLRLERVQLAPGNAWDFAVTPGVVVTKLTSLLVSLGASNKVAEYLSKFLVDHMCYRQRGTVALESSVESPVCFLFDGYYIRLTNSV